MILQNSFDVLNSLDDALSNTDIILDAAQNTYLSSLLYETTEDVLHPVIGKSSATETGHDIIQDKMIEVISKSIINQLGVIRSEIIPNIKSFYEKLKETIKAYNSNNPLLDISIVSRSIPEILNTDEFRKLLDSFKDIIPVEPIKFTGLNSYSDDLMNRVNAASREYYQENYHDANILDKIYNGTYSNIFYGLDSLSYKINSTMHHDILEEALGKYLMLDFISSHEDLAVELINADSLDHLRNVFSSIKRYLLSILARNKDLIENRSNGGNGLLVINYDRYAKTINVNAEVYQNFLNNGGCPEVILGVFASSKSSPSDYFYQNLIDLKDKYLENFHQYSRIEEETRKLNYYDAFKTFFRLLFLQETSNYSEFEKEYHNLNPGAQERIIDLLNEKLDKVYIDAIKDDSALYNTVARILTSTRYYYTDAHNLLKYIDEEHTDDKDISSTVAIAVIYYLVDYFVDQMTVYPRR